MIEPGRRSITQGIDTTTKISFQDADGRSVSGPFQVSRGMITVLAVDGRTKTAKIEEGMLGPETLAKMLLFQLHQEGRH